MIDGVDVIRSKTLFFSSLFAYSYITPNSFKEDWEKSSSDRTRPGQNQTGSPNIQKVEILKNAPECHEGEA
jgi:hypothetical protein